MGWQHRLVHPSGARVISCGDELLGILARERLLVICLSEGARHRRVSIFDVEPTRKTNVPIVMALVDVGVFRPPHLRLSRRNCRLERDNAPSVWDQLPRDANPCATLCPRVISKWSTTASSTTASTSTTWASTYPSRKLLLHRDSQLLDRGYVEDGPVPS